MFTKHNVKQAENDTNCFKVHFMSVLLTDGYGFNSKNWDTLRIKKKVCLMLNLVTYFSSSSDVSRCDGFDTCWTQAKVRHNQGQGQGRPTMQRSEGKT